ncbi:UDP-N-acetylmuramoyl-L-alanyl-D-glutamate--2,6-diaminopimelate ligase [Piscinibacter sp. HJYY11]|uniref:UDP-N-acetylmuramoyl-L-alanyl-D-glutamate--2, 6-diaminopimelate ligase n=1 Tax=Piscinibacter sp. HJYY11 TaxID=2801333 RepID=UPI00191DB302|nr:UDP-N-acetylmuramoyl-L-alanyl-D-glutamate--2,6-diaminopimelate ligase [Piscinibacter sp. HJYY11]MBL0727962.1 UDP-N-acetylmuramoyl-L-alanyl-D-glutamate--2,6-diaminopimelate ligase [Piscinibacter sp. HJYY11]
MATLTTLHDVGSAVAWLRSRGVKQLRTDSRRVQPGDAFIAWPGYANDGRQFVPAALAAGAVACLVEAKGAEAFHFDGVQVGALAGLKAATGPLASAWYEQPSKLLDVVAITGTNGKTSTAWWVAQALSLLGKRCGVVGTLGVGEPPSAAAAPNASIQSTGLTTPDPVTLQAGFKRFVDQGFKACAIEASSIGIVERRMAGTQVAVALFTNFTRDHIDYHGSMEAYWAAKSELFMWPGLRAAVLNVDDERGATLAPALQGLMDVWTYSTHAEARLRASDIAYRDGGLVFTVHEGDASTLVRTGLIGDYNVSNLLAVIGGLRALGFALGDIARVCAQLTPVPGRMQQIGGGEQPVVVVDYAHTPDALEKALQAVRPFAQERQGTLWCVFGCGGNRDATKRPLMGAIAERQADQVVVTSDNPRMERPGQILTQITAGMARPDRALVIEDRRAAIVHAVTNAKPQDVILVAGKGHEAEQDIGGVKHPFSDVEESRTALAARVSP